MYWTLILKISATVLLLACGLLTIPHTLLGATFKNILLGIIGVSGAVAALSVFKLKGIGKTHSVSETNQLNSHSKNAAASKNNSDVRDDA